MSTSESFAGVNNILCPTDLGASSQKTLRFAMQIAAALGAKLTAFHSAAGSWLYQSDEQFREGIEEIETEIKRAVSVCDEAANDAVDFDVIVEKSSDPHFAIPRLARELNIDMIVMRARPGVLSALHFGSIVERVVSDVNCPVLLMPSRFLADHDPDAGKLSFRRILFDYDFSQATDHLFHVANALARGYAAELHILSVLEPPAAQDVEFATLNRSLSLLESAVQNRLRAAVQSDASSPSAVSSVVQWGSRADRVLEYAEAHQIELLCTTLPRPSYFTEKVYRRYLGQLLASAACPVVVKQCV